MTAFELTRQQVAQPSFKQCSNTTLEEKPHAPSRSPNTAAGTLSYRASVKAVVDEMFKIFAHSNLSHQLVLVTVHASQLTNVSKNVLKTVSQLESVDVVETILDMGVDNQLCQTQDFATKMESISET